MEFKASYDGFVAALERARVELRDGLRYLETEDKSIQNQQNIMLFKNVINRIDEILTAYHPDVTIDDPYTRKVKYNMKSKTKNFIFDYVLLETLWEHHGSFKIKDAIIEIGEKLDKIFTHLERIRTEGTGQIRWMVYVRYARLRLAISEIIIYIKKNRGIWQLNPNKSVLIEAIKYHFKSLDMEEYLNGLHNILTEIEKTPVIDTDNDKWY